MAKSTSTQKLSQPFLTGSKASTIPPSCGTNWLLVIKPLGVQSPSQGDYFSPLQIRDGLKRLKGVSSFIFLRLTFNINCEFQRNSELYNIGHDLGLDCRRCQLEAIMRQVLPGIKRWHFSLCLAWFAVWWYFPANVSNHKKTWACYVRWEDLNLVGHSDTAGFKTWAREGRNSSKRKHNPAQFRMFYAVFITMVNVPTYFNKCYDKNSPLAQVWSFSRKQEK